MWPAPPFQRLGVVGSLLPVQDRSPSIQDATLGPASWTPTAGLFDLKGLKASHCCWYHCLSVAYTLWYNYKPSCDQKRRILINPKSISGRQQWARPRTDS